MLKLLLSYFIMLTMAGASKPILSQLLYDINGRIVGGKDADIKDYPYQLFLSNGQDYCGAVIIDSNWGITGAHCIYGYEPNEIYLMGNSTLINDGVNISVSNIIPHPNFDYFTGDFDVALLQFTESLTCVNCKPIALSKTLPLEGENITITGWGVTESDYDDYTEGSSILQVAQVPIANFTECKEYYGVYRLNVSENMFCAGLMGIGEVDACGGDSGGPAVYDGKLVGTVSWGIGCAMPWFMGVYVRIEKFVNWIEETTGIEGVS